MIQERQYQTEVRKQLYRLFNKGVKKVLIVAPTGSGKTVVSTQIIKDAVLKNRKVLFLIHRDILAEQTAKTLEIEGLNASFIMGNKSYDPSALIQIASVQTLAVREIDFEPDLIFYDEAHLTAWARQGKELLKKDCWHVGLTATPWRLKRTEGMGDLFDELINTPLPYQLIEMGYLVPPRYFTLPTANLSNVKIVAGDYSNKELSVVCNDSRVIDSLVDNWIKIANGKRTIVFTVDVKHSEAVANAFQSRGINAQYVSGKTPLNERAKIYQDLKDNVIQVVISCEALSEGFNVPSIECVCLARPTKSKAKYFQQVGRGLRIAEGKTECLVLDQAGLVQDFGFIEDLRTVRLEHGKAKGKGETMPCIKCEKVRVSVQFKVCVKCAERQEKLKDLPIGDMIELVIQKGKKREFDFYRLRIKKAFENGYSPGWALYQFKEHYGYFPSSQWAKHSIWDNPTKQNKKDYLNYLLKQVEKKKLEGAEKNKFIQKYFNQQFGS